MRIHISASVALFGLTMAIGCASDDAHRTERLYPQAYGFENNPNLERDRQKVQQVEGRERGFFQ